MCFEHVAWCEFCHFERHITWQRCPQWRRTFEEEVIYTGVFSFPPIPKPEDCPRLRRHVLVPVRPGSCPIGPPPAFVREERLRRRAYLRNFGYPDDTDEENEDDEDLPFGIRGSPINGCVGYEVRARLMHGPEWRRNWTHRNLRARMGLPPCDVTIDPNPPQKPLVELPIPKSDLEVLAEGEQPTRPRTTALTDVAPRPGGIRWTHRLKYPPHSRQAMFYESESDGASVDTDTSVDFEAISLGTDSEASPVPAPLSPQPQRRRRGVAVTGGRENLDLNNLLIPRLAMPRQRVIPPMLGQATQAVEEQTAEDAEDPIDEEALAGEDAPSEEEQPFQRPRSYSPRLYWGVPRGLMRRRYAEEEAAIIADIKAKGGVPFEPTYAPEPPAQPIPIRNPRKRTRKPLPKHDFSD